MATTEDAVWLDTATAGDLRFQLYQTRIGVRPPSINGSVAALRFFFDRNTIRDDDGVRLGANSSWRDVRIKASRGGMNATA